MAGLNDEQSEIVERVLTGENIFITGSGGVGKSYIIDRIQRQFDSLSIDYITLAPTGVAALNISGKTIHRAFGLRPDIVTLQDYIRLSKKRSNTNIGVLLA